jgi:AcrR family transcriptional regulator
MPREKYQPSTSPGDFTAISAVTTPRARPSKVDRTLIAKAALDIVNQEGLGGLTMRRVADSLGAGLATVYNAVGSKNAILDDMIELVFAQLPAADHSPGCELTSLIDLWSAAHDLLFDNPSIAQLTALKPAGGHGLLALIESTFELLRGVGVEEQLITVAFETTRSYTLGFTLLRISRSEPAAVDVELRLAEVSDRQPDRYPEIVALTPAMTGAMNSENFKIGLSHLLQGFLPATNSTTTQ